jgi:hypothetical protein
VRRSRLRPCPSRQTPQRPRWQARLDACRSRPPSSRCRPPVRPRCSPATRAGSGSGCPGAAKAWRGPRLKAGSLRCHSLANGEIGRSPA